MGRSVLSVRAGGALWWCGWWRRWWGSGRGRGGFGRSGVLWAPLFVVVMVVMLEVDGGRRRGRHMRRFTALLACRLPAAPFGFSSRYPRVNSLPTLSPPSLIHPQHEPRHDLQNTITGRHLASYFVTWHNGTSTRSLKTDLRPGSRDPGRPSYIPTAGVHRPTGTSSGWR